MTENSKTLYVATNTEMRQGCDAEFFVLGVYENVETALAVLEKQAKEDIECAMCDEDDIVRKDGQDGFFIEIFGCDRYYYNIVIKPLE